MNVTAQQVAQPTTLTGTQANYQESPALIINSIQPASLRIKPGSQPVHLYFPNLINIRKDPALMLGNPLVRDLQGPDCQEQAIQALLLGPSDRERLQGFFQDDDVKALQLADMRLAFNGNATVVLEAPEGFQFKNLSTPHRLDAQIRRTLQQFDSIREVSVSIRRAAEHQVIWTSP